MKDNYEIVQMLKNGNQQRKDFFLQKIKMNLKKYNYQIDSQELEKLFMEAVNDYPENSKSMFYFYALNHIRKNLENNETTSKNELFSELETLIIKKYLSTENNKFLQSDEIATELGENITTVTKTIYKLKQYMKLEPLAIQNIFGPVSTIIHAREKSSTTLPRKQISLTEEDLELLGLYTGQIDDICMDITELAKKYNKIPKIIEIKLKDIFTLLNKNNIIKNQVLTKYPEIEPMLKIKAKALNKKLPPKIQQKKTRHKKETINRQVSAGQVTLLTQLYMKKDDGSFYTYKEVAEIMEIDYTNFINRKNRLLKKLEENSSFKSQILEIIPNLLTLQEEYNQVNGTKSASTPLVVPKKEEKKLTKTMQKNIKFLTQLYSKKEDGTFYTYKETAKKLEISYQNFITKKNKLLKRLQEQEGFKNIVLEHIPNLIELQEQSQTQKQPKDEPKSTKQEKKFQKDIAFLTQLYSKKEDGSFYTYKETAKKLEMSYQNFITKKNKLLKKLEAQEEFKHIVLQHLPNLIELQAENTTNKQHKTTTKSKATTMDLSEKEQKLINLYQDTTEKVMPKHILATKLNISPTAFSILKNATVKKLTTNPLLAEKYQQPVENIIIKDNFRKTNSITMSEEELKKIKQTARYYDIPHAPQKTSSRDKLWKGIKALEESTYKDYASLCTTEQKAMLALRLGFFNESIFSSSDIANFFHTTKEEVSLLTTECLKTAVPELQKINIKQKK